jgi:hypothetical protein
MSRDMLFHRSNCLIFAQFKHTRRMAKERKSPQEKKELEYKLDRRTFAWHQDKGLRIARRRRKDTINRAYRHKADSVVRQAAEAAELGEATELTNSLIADGLTNKRLRKYTPYTLAEAIDRKTNRRASHENFRKQRDDRYFAFGTTSIEAMEQMSKTQSIEFLDKLRNYSRLFINLSRQKDPMLGLLRWVQSVSMGDAFCLKFLQSNPDWAARYDKVAARLNKLDEEIQRKVRTRKPLG